MPDQPAEIDVASLEDFQARLVGRLVETEYALATMRLQLGRRPELGLFADGVDLGRRYHEIHADQLARLERLKSALVAVSEATATIISNYTTTEARNAANAEEIAAVLDPVSTALQESTSS
jgi:hypothetical protein